MHQRAFAVLHSEGARASELAYHALLAGEAEAAYRASVLAGMEAVAVFAVADAIRHYEQARALLQESQQMQTELPALEVERLYAHLGRAYAFQNAWQQAQEAYEELLAYAHQHRLSTLISMTLNRLAILALQQSNDKPKVRALLEEAWHMAETSHDQRALAETEWNLALITAVMWENPTSALPHGQQALSQARALHNQELEARSLCSLGWIHLLGGDFQEAMHCVEASLALYALLGNEPFGSRELSLPCFLKCSKTYLQHLRTCFIAGSFTLDASRASASRSTGEFLSRRSHNRDIRYQTEGFVPDVQGRIQISLVNYLTLLTYPLSDIEREVFQPNQCIVPGERGSHLVHSILSLTRCAIVSFCKLLGILPPVPASLSLARQPFAQSLDTTQVLTVVLLVLKHHAIAARC